MQPGRSRPIAASFVVAAAALWLRAGFPAQAYVAGYDDLLYVRLARHLANGEWLGPYDKFTLAKGMFYPAFVAACSLAGLPVKLAEYAVYLASSAAAAALVVRLGASRLVGGLLFAALAFDPLFWHPALARVTREALYVGLSFGAFVLAAFALLVRDARAALFSARTLLLLAAGLVGAAFWLTREEGIWLAPPLAVLAGAAIATEWRAWRDDPAADGGARGVARRCVLTCGLPLLAFCAPVVSVAAVNFSRYGAFSIGEFHSGSFKAAYGALSRIRPDEWQRYVVYPRAARERARQASGAARELDPVLEGPRGEYWREIGCTALRLDPCPEIPAGWFPWALRDGVAVAGHYRSAPEALAFYERLAAEIDAACDDGRLACLPPRATLAPPFRWHYVGDAVAPALALTGSLVAMGGGEVGVPLSSGPEEQLEIFRQMVSGLSPRVRRPLSRLTGIVAGRELPPRVSVVGRKGVKFEVRLEQSPVSDPGASPPGLRANRFELVTDCPPKTCELVVKGPRAGELRFPLGDLAAGTVKSGADLHLELDSVTTRNRASEQLAESEKAYALHLAIARAVARGYAALMPALAALAAIGFALALATRRVGLPPGLAALATASLAAVAARIGLLAYLEVSSFPAELRYLAPAAPFLILFTALGLAGPARAAASTLRRPAPRGGSRSAGTGAAPGCPAPPTG